jgi:Xaa-Pro aminopeptidase
MRRGILPALPALVLVLGGSPVASQRIEYPPEEFQARRTALCEELTEAGMVMLFSETSPPIGVRFRQDHDFYYVTGNEDKNAVVLIDAESCEAWLFLPPQTEREASRDGWNWLYQEGADERWGFETIYAIHYLEEFLARRRVSGPQRLYVRLSERDLIDQSRTDAALFFARRLTNPWGGQPSEGAWRVEQLRARYPHYELADVTPAIDELRMHKTPREIEALRRNGRVSAAAMARAIALTRAGRYEYEIEAAATHEMISNGAEHAAYPAIVGSGPNGIVWHHNANDRRFEDGDLVVMDYGASFGYQTMDITRTWPVSGKFDELQARAYRAVLEAQKAIIAAMGPGVERARTKEIAQEIFERHGFGEGHFPGGAGHFVGMAVHDIGDYERPLEVGMVIAVEPIIELRDHDIHIRIEDTVLITQDGAENLSASVPKELEAIEALVGTDDG